MRGAKEMSSDYERGSGPSLQDMVDDCMMCCEDLTDWEIEFVDSVAFRLGAGQDVTVNQWEKLTEIREKVCGGASRKEGYGKELWWD